MWNQIINKELHLKAFRVYLPNLDQRLAKYFGEVEFSFVSLDSLCRSIGVADWVVKLAERLSKNYTVINETVYYVSNRGLEHPRTEPLEALSSAWGVDASILRIVKERLLNR